MNTLARVSVLGVSFACVGACSGSAKVAVVKAPPAASAEAAESAEASDVPLEKVAPGAVKPAAASYGYDFDEDDLRWKRPRNARPDDENAKAREAGRLPPADIQAALRAQAASKMLGCYDEGKKRDPKLNGTIVLRFTVTPEGKAALARAGESTDLADAVAVGCVVQTLSGVTFPKPAGSGVTVLYPVKLASGPIPLAERVVGTWRFDFTGEHRAKVEADLKKKAGKDAKKLEKLMKDAEAEAAASRFEITRNTIASKVGDQVLFRVSYQQVGEKDGALTVKITGKPDGHAPMAPGAEIVLAGDKGMLSFEGDDAIVMRDPKKGALRFNRQ